jgi:hypothetical protein
MISIRDLGAPGDGTSHPLSLAFSTLAEAREAFPLAELESLAVQMDTAALLQAFGMAQQMTSSGAAPPVVKIPAGEYRISRTLAFRPKVARVVSSGIRIVGDGPLASRLVLEGKGWTMDIGADPEDPSRPAFVKFVTLEGVGFRAPQGGGLRLNRCLEVRLTDVAFRQCQTAGLLLASEKGDADAPNSVLLANCEFEGCPGWGMDAKSAHGRNEIGALTLINCRFSQCGQKSDVTPPPSGGLRWKGQVMTVINGLFAQNQNGGLVIPGEAGLAANASLLNCTFENNTGRAIYISGVESFLMQRGTLRSSLPSVFPALCGVELAGEFAIKGVTLEGVRVQARPGLGDYALVRGSGRNGGYGSLVNPEFYDFAPGYQKVDRGVHNLFAFGFDVVEQGRSSRGGRVTSVALGPESGPVVLDPTQASDWLIEAGPGAKGVALAYPQQEYSRRSTDGPGRRVKVKILNSSGRALPLSCSGGGLFRGALPTAVFEGLDLEFLLRFVPGKGLVYELVSGGPEPGEMVLGRYRVDLGQPQDLPIDTRSRPWLLTRVVAVGDAGAGGPVSLSLRRGPLICRDVFTGEASMPQPSSSSFVTLAGGRGTVRLVVMGVLLPA